MRSNSPGMAPSSLRRESRALDALPGSSRPVEGSRPAGVVGAVASGDRSYATARPMLVIAETGGDEGVGDLLHPLRAQAPDVLELVLFEEPEDVPDGLRSAGGMLQGVERMPRQTQT